MAVDALKTQTRPVIFTEFEALTEGVDNEYFQNKDEIFVAIRELSYDLQRPALVIERDGHPGISYCPLRCASIRAAKKNRKWSADRFSDAHKVYFDKLGQTSLHQMLLTSVARGILRPIDHLPSQLLNFFSVQGR